MIRKIVLCASIVVFVGSLVGIAWYLWSLNVMTDVPPAPLPTEPTAQVVTMKPQATSEPSPQVKVPENPRGEPKQLIVWHGDKVIVSMYFAPAVYSSLGWASECGKVAYRDIDNWPKPGYLSKDRSLITGHVWCYGDVYGLSNLDQIRAGDRLEISYNSGDVVVAIAESDAVSIDKGELNVEKAGERNPTMHNASKARTIRLSSCDTSSPVRSDGHLSRNEYGLFTVTEIRYVT